MYKKVLVAYDGSERALASVREAAEFAASSGAELVVLHVIRFFAGANMPGVHFSEELIQENHDEMKQEGMELLQKAEAAIADIDCVKHFNVEVGPTASRIVSFAEQEGCELIFMGNRGCGALKELVLGSTTSRVVRMSHIPVLVGR